MNLIVIIVGIVVLVAIGAWFMSGKGADSNTANYNGNGKFLDNGRYDNRYNHDDDGVIVGGGAEGFHISHKKQRIVAFFIFAYLLYSLYQIEYHGFRMYS
jgi:hypothetical protein